MYHVKFAWLPTRTVGGKFKWLSWIAVLCDGTILELNDIAFNDRM